YESGRSPVFVIRESNKNNIARDPFYFQDKKLAKYDEDALNEIRISGAYQITLAPQDTLGWFVSGDTTIKLEQSDMNRLFSAISGVTAAELVSEKSKNWSVYGLKNPFLEVVMTDTTGLSTGYSIGNSDEDNDRYAVSRASSRIYKVSLFSVERIVDWIEEIRETEPNLSTE
ncbi:MAG TPA: DUF4340 domain-containing protein, partial [Candidatus Marinimicrobia bacterium]|nr:DUF4340 domain-containing protein [Candidatus Neomarinimicrobiota bacterium]